MVILFSNSKVEDFLKAETIQIVERINRAEYDASTIPISEHKWDVAKEYITSMLIGLDVAERFTRFSSKSMPIDLYNCVKHLREKIIKNSDDEVYVQEKLKPGKYRVQIEYGGIPENAHTPILNYRDRVLLEELVIETLNKAADSLSSRDLIILSKLVEKFGLEFFCYDHKQLIRCIVGQELITQTKLDRHAKKAAIKCLKRIFHALIAAGYPLVEQIPFSSGGIRIPWDSYRLILENREAFSINWFAKAIRFSRVRHSKGKAKKKKYLRGYSRFMLATIIREMSNGVPLEQFDSVEKVIDYFSARETNRARSTIRNNAHELARLIRRLPPPGFQVVRLDE